LAAVLVTARLLAAAGLQTPVQRAVKVSFFRLQLSILK